MQPETIKELHEVLKSSDGIIQESSIVIMTLDAYREMLGVGTDEELAASVAALRKSMSEARQGKTRPFTDFLDELGRKYEVQG